ncbi:sigma 54-interacting transcriptional regulator [bacterium]|nr:sigma 54-interacting transcriptional regulator [bacterium]
MNAEERLRIMTKVTGAVLAHHDFGGFFQAVADCMKELLPNVDDFGIARYRAEREEFEIIATIVEDEATTNMGVRSGRGEHTPGGFLLKRGRTTMVNDMDAFEKQLGARMREKFRRPFQSAIGALLEHGDKLIGYMYITSMQKSAWDEHHRDVFDLIRTVVTLAVDNALAYDELHRMKEEAELQGQYLRSEIEENFPADGLIGRSRLWKSVIAQVQQVAPTESTVLIQGETGTGKEVLARAIHERSTRARKPLIKVNCGALPENLIESELFGHERGAFTGAMNRRVGRFELAHGGTIFLDEIGEMPMSLQVRLLRVLQEREFERVGGEKPIRVNVRVITATNKDLRAEVAAGRFRADLYYRLNVFPIDVPPLRVRPEDAVLLTKYFLQRFAERIGRKGLQLTEESVQAVANYSWPGNVRELEHLVERGIILAQGNQVDLKALLMPNPATLAFPSDPPSPMATLQMPDVSQPAREVAEGKKVSLKDSFAEAERSAIIHALEECNYTIGGKNGAAAMLGLKRQTLQSKIKKLGIPMNKGKSEPVGSNS